MDLRIQKTYRSLLAAFTRLLETYRYEDITVAMLCDEAMIRRTTFYKHFADKSEFFSFFVDSLRVELTEYGERQVEGRRAKADEVAGASSDVRVGCLPDEEEGLAILQALVDFMVDHERLVDNIFESAMSGMMVLMMEDRVAETLRERYRDSFRVNEGDPRTLFAASEFAAGGIVRLLEKWWVRGHRDDGKADLITVAEAMVARVMRA